MPKLLIVEDDADIVENLSVLLQDEGYSVCHASDSKGALNQLHTSNFDLVLLDISLPDGNGYAICTAVKRLTNAPVIFLTAMTDESSIITGFQLGADDYITKPFKPMELVFRVRNALRKSRKAPSVFQVEEHSLPYDFTREQYRLPLLFSYNIVMKKSRTLQPKLLYYIKFRSTLTEI